MRSELLYLVELESHEAVDNARAWVRPTSGEGTLAVYAGPAGGSQLQQPIYSGADGYLHCWVEGAPEALVQVDDNDSQAVLVSDHYTHVAFDPTEQVVHFAEVSGHSYFLLRARGDGTLAVVKIVATLDHGDVSDLTTFIVEHAAEPYVAGATCEWRADGVVTLELDDLAEEHQDAMLGFLYLALLSGRFRMPEDVQALIFGGGS